MFCELSLPWDSCIWMDTFIQSNWWCAFRQIFNSTILPSRNGDVNWKFVISELWSFRKCHITITIAWRALLLFIISEDHFDSGDVWKDKWSLLFRLREVAERNIWAEKSIDSWIIQSKEFMFRSVFTFLARQVSRTWDARTQLHLSRILCSSKLKILVSPHHHCAQLAFHDRLQSSFSKCSCLTSFHFESKIRLSNISPIPILN